MLIEPTFLLDELMRLIERYMTPGDIERVHEAYKLADHAHDGVVRRSGERYITHPLSVAIILADMRVDADTVCAALLHDVVEDTTYGSDDIEAQLGGVVARLVDGVTKLDKKNFESKQDAVIASFRKMMEFFVEDYRVVLVKLADRLHNLRTLEHMSAPSRRRIAKETIAVYVPLAQRMGLNAIRRDMQLLAFKHMHHWRAKTLQASLDLYLSANKQKHGEIVQEIQKALQKPIPSASVFLWEKNLYRIYERVKRDGKRFGELREVLEIRVVLGSADDCYRALGILHSLYPPKLGEFYDFIASPMTYGFQALQTTVLHADTQQQLRFQIQTRDMYHISQYGIAALWRYPELTRKAHGRITQQAVDTWLDQVKELASLAENPAEFHADMQAALFLSEVYAFTPRGELKEFPAGATVVDFAYAIHTEVGHHCIAAKVDGVHVPLRSRIPSGSTVEIITETDAMPQLSWLQFVITAKARSAIRGWERQQSADDFFRLGENLLSQALRQKMLSLIDIPEARFQHVLDIVRLDSKHALFTAIGKKEQSAALIAHRLVEGSTEVDMSEREQAPLKIKGSRGLCLSFDSCCYPIPGEPIQAVLNESGLVIHREACPVLHRTVVDSEIMDVAWAEQNEQANYMVAIRTQAHNVVGVIRQIASVLAHAQVNIEDIHTSGDQYIKETRLVLWVRDTDHLQDIMRQLSHINNIIKVERIIEDGV